MVYIFGIPSADNLHGIANGDMNLSTNVCTCFQVKVS